MKTAIVSLLITLILGNMSSLLAIRYAPAKDLEVRSPNGKFTLKVNAETESHEIYEGDKVLWSFKRDVWHNECFLSNDGQRVLWVDQAARRVGAPGHEEAIKGRHDQVRAGGGAGQSRPHLIIDHHGSVRCPVGFN